jgi:hypothetical protein
MDFITLATELDVRRLLRALNDAVGEDDDDVSIAVPLQVSPAMSEMSVPVTMGPDLVTQKPLFSKTAEAELYLLATNFLLYVAMVIITTMVSACCRPSFIVTALPDGLANRFTLYRHTLHRLPRSTFQSLCSVPRRLLVGHDHILIAWPSVRLTRRTLMLGQKVKLATMMKMKCWTVTMSWKKIVRF